MKRRDRSWASLCNRPVRRRENEAEIAQNKYLELAHPGEAQSYAWSKDLMLPGKIKTGFLNKLITVTVDSTERPKVQHLSPLRRFLSQLVVTKFLRLPRAALSSLAASCSCPVLLSRQYRLTSPGMTKLQSCLLCVSKPPPQAVEPLVHTPITNTGVRRNM